jgi:antirestriction protein ArdC
MKESAEKKSTLDDLDWPAPRSKSEELRQNFAKKIIGLMEEGKAPWQCPWSLPPNCMPVNAVSGKRYNGNNTFYLMIAAMNVGYADPRWATYKQAQEQGWQVRKGETGTKIEYWSEYDPTQTKKSAKRLNERIRDMTDGEFSPEKAEESREGYKVGFVKHYTVFNAAQIEGIPPLEIEPVIKEFNANERAEKIMDNCGVSIVYGSAGAFYNPDNDRIRMPNRELFVNEEHFYATVLHEIAHSTGHPSRLDREEGMKSVFGTQEYAKEELRAEMASLFIHAGIGLVVTEEGMEQHTQNHAAYVQSWMEILKEDYKEFFRATKDANKIADYVLAYEREQARERNGIESESEAVPAPDGAAARAVPESSKARAVEIREAVKAGDSVYSGEQIEIARQTGLPALPERLDRESESSRDESVGDIEIGQRVTFKPHNGTTTLVGVVKEINEQEVTLQCGRASIPVLREKGNFTKAPELDAGHTKDFAKEQAQKHVGKKGGVFLAKGEDAAYNGPIVEVTPSYAIQKVGEDAILHRLKDLGKDQSLISVGQDVVITKGGKGEILVERNTEQARTREGLSR